MVSQLGGNGIADLGESILVPLTGLTCLMLEDNRLLRLPRSIGRLVELRYPLKNGRTVFGLLILTYNGL